MKEALAKKKKVGENKSQTFTAAKKKIEEKGNGKGKQCLILHF